MQDDGYSLAYSQFNLDFVNIEKEPVPAEKIVLIADAHNYLGSVPAPFNDPDYEWEMPIRSLADMMSETMPHVQTQFDGHSIQNIIKTLKGRAVLSGLLQSKALRLDHPTFVEAAHLCLEEHTKLLLDIHSRMNKSIRQKTKQQEKLQKQIERQAAKEKRQLEQQERKTAKLQERACSKNNKLLERESIKQERQRIRQAKQAEKRAMMHLKKRNTAPVQKKPTSDSDSSDSDEAPSLHPFLPPYQGAYDLSKPKLQRC